MLPSNPSVSKAGALFQLELFQISSIFLTFHSYFLLSFSTDGWLQRKTEVFQHSFIKFTLIYLYLAFSLLCLFFISVLRNYSPFSCVSRLLTSSLSIPALASNSPATLNFPPLEIYAHASIFPTPLLYVMNYLSLKRQAWPPT